MTEVNYTGNRITIDGRTTSLNYPIKTAVELPDFVLVLLEVPTGEVCNRNVIAFGLDGDERWKIDPSPHGTQNDNPYMSLSIEDGEIIVDTWNGMRYSVDEKTGSIEPIEHNRF